MAQHVETPKMMMLKQKILIVDDKKENLIALRHILREVDAEVIEASDGNEALAATLDHDFAVFLLDVQMPGMNGYELAEHLRGEKKTQVIPIVFLTAGYVDETAIFKGYEAGAVDYIMKPCPPAVLRGKVNAFLEIAGYRRELELSRNHLERLVAERTANLAERIKELKCLYSISNLVSESCMTSEKVLEAAVDLLLSGFQYPGITCSMIIFEGREFKSANFRETTWRFSTEIMLSAQVAGTLDVYCLEERGACGGEPFLKEEREMIANIARQLGVGIERKRAELALRSAKEEWERTFAAVPELIAMIDLNHRIVRANLPMAERTGIDCDKLTGRHFYEVIHGLAAPPDSCPSAAMQISGKAEHAEMQIAHLGGTFDVSATPLRDSEGQISGHVYVARDITAQKIAEAEHEKTESELRQAQKMEAVGQLAGGVAHDFNNMLSVIIGYSDILLDEIPQDDPAHSSIQEINDAGKRSADLTRQLLAFARKQAILPKVLDINMDIESMLKMMRRLLRENIELIWKPTPDLWKVKMDPSQIHQILVNLTVNSRDAISGVGKLLIGTGNVNPDKEFYRRYPYFTHGNYVVLSVSDNGCGMSQETLGRIFEPFFTTKKAGEGTGLGLATVFGIVKQNGGFINVSSELGKGTTFEIYLPRHVSEDAEKDQKVQKAKITTGTETVLLVEDEAPLLKFAKEMLGRLGYTVLAAGSPAEAIRTAGEFKGHIHLLMTDMLLPEMSGLELSDKIKATRPDIKCLFMSGYTADVMSHNGILNAGIHFLEKPFAMDNLSTKNSEKSH